MLTRVFSATILPWKVNTGAGEPKIIITCQPEEGKGGVREFALW